MAGWSASMNSHAQKNLLIALMLVSSNNLELFLNFLMISFAQNVKRAIFGTRPEEFVMSAHLIV